jgi:hypothetical protein
MAFFNHIRVLHTKLISQIYLFATFLKQTIEKFKINSNFMCFSIALFLCGKRAFCVGKALAQKEPVDTREDEEQK